MFASAQSLVTQLYRVDPEGPRRGLEYPSGDGVVIAPARQRLAVGAEGHGANPACVPLECADRRAARNVPQDDGLVLAPARQRLAVGAEGHGENRVCVPLECTDRRAARNVPQDDCVVVVVVVFPAKPENASNMQALPGSVRLIPGCIDFGYAYQDHWHELGVPLSGGF